MSALRIREADPADLDAVGRISVAAYNAIAGYDMSDGYRGELADGARRLRDARLLVAEADGRVVGTVTFVPGPGPLAEVDDPDAAGVRMLAVDPSAQGRGVGAALLAACVEQAREGGQARVVLHSTPWMTAAHRLYGRLGFRRDADLDLWVSDGAFPLLAYRLEVG